MYDLLRIVSRFVQKACVEKIYRTDVVFERKIVDFPFKKQRQS